MTDRSIPNSNEFGFRQFILDPKTSVKTYLSQSLLDEKPAGNMENHDHYPNSSPPYVQHSTPSNHEVNHHGGIAPSSNGVYAVSPQPDDGSTYSSFPHQHSQHQDSSHGVPQLHQSQEMPQVFPGQYQDLSYRAPKPHSPQVYQNPLQSSTHPSSSPTPIGQPQQQPLQTYGDVLQQPQMLSNPLYQEQAANSQTRYGPAPPPPDSINDIAIKAPRTYHRMIVDFETLKAAFYSAKASEFFSSSFTSQAQKSNLTQLYLSDPHHIDLSPLAAKLKTLARDIWTLRFTRAAEFDYTDIIQEHIVTLWKEEFELWSDVLEDLADPIQSKKDAAADLANNYSALAGLDEAKAPAMAKSTVNPVVKKAAAAADGVVAKPAAKPVAKPAAKPAVKVAASKPAV